MGRLTVLAAILLAIPSAAADPPTGNVPRERVSPRLIRTLPHPNPNSPIWLLQYSPDGRRLAAAGYPSGILQIWDPATGKELSWLTPPNGERGTAEFGALTSDWKTAFTPYEGRKFFQFGGGVGLRTFLHYDGGVRVWDVATGKLRPPIKLGPGRGVSEVVASPDGTKLVTIELLSYEQTDLQPVPFAVVYRDLSKNGPPIELADGFGMAAFAPDGKAFVLATGNRFAGRSRIRLFDALTAKETTMLAEEAKANIFYPAFSPDSKRIAAEVRNLEETASVIKVWDRDSGKELAVLEPVEITIVLYPQFSAGGRFVMAAARAGTGYVWDAATGKRLVAHRRDEKDFTRTLAVSPDDRLAAVVGGPKYLVTDPDPAHYAQPRVVVYDLASGKPVETLVCSPGFPAKAAFSPDGKTLAVGGSGAVHLFDVGDIVGAARGR